MWVLLLGLLLLANAAHGASIRGSGSVLGQARADCRPQQVLLSLGSDATQMHLSWRTAGPNCPAEVVFQRLGDLTTEQLLQQQRLEDQEQQQQQPLVMGMANTANAVGFSFLLSERDMCDDPAASNPFIWQLHRATLKDLEPSAAYRYRIEGGEHHQYFKAAPAPSPDASFTFLGFGDMGDAVHPAAKSPGAASTLLRLQAEAEASHNPAELMLHVGDLAYGDGNPEVWDSFLQGLSPFAGRVPYMIAVGNHEQGYNARKGSFAALTDPSGATEPYRPSWGNYGPDSRGECGVIAARRFHMPDYKGRRDNAPFWYGFDYGSVHFTTISTEHSLVPGSRQYKWLEAELAAVDRCVTPWLVVLLHRPMYVVFPHKSNREVGEHIRAQIEPLLLQHKVDLTVAGHVHSYYRTCAVRDEQCVDGYTHAAAAAAAAAGAGISSEGNAGSSHITAAGAAAGLQQRGRHGIVHLIIGSAGRKLSDVERDQAAWCEETVKEWGYGRFTVRGRRSLLVEFVSSEAGQVLDSVELRQPGGDALCSPAAAAAAAS